MKLESRKRRQEKEVKRERSGWRGRGGEKEVP